MNQVVTIRNNEGKACTTKEVSKILKKPTKKNQQASRKQLKSAGLNNKLGMTASSQYKISDY